MAKIRDGQTVRLTPKLVDGLRRHLRGLQEYISDTSACSVAVIRQELLRLDELARRAPDLSGEEVDEMISAAEIAYQNLPDDEVIKPVEIDRLLGELLYEISLND